MGIMGLADLVNYEWFGARVLDRWIRTSIHGRAAAIKCIERSTKRGYSYTENLLLR